MTNIRAVFDEFGPHSMGNFQGFLNGRIDAGITRSIKGDIKFQVKAPFFCFLFHHCQVFRARIVVEVNKGDMKHFDMFLFGKVHEVDEGTGLFKSIGLAFALEAPAFPVTAQVKGITVHAEFELSVAVFSRNLVHFQFSFVVSLSNSVDAVSFPEKFGRHSRNAVKSPGKGGIAAVADHDGNVHHGIMGL